MLTSETKTLGAASFAIFGVALLVLGGMAYFVYKKNAVYEEQMHARAVRTATEREVQSLGRILDETAQDREALTGYVLTEDSVVDFLSHISELARSQGVTAETRSLAVAPIEGNKTFEYLTLEVTVLGSFESVTRMLSLLESLPYQVSVRTVTVDRTAKEGGPSLWRGAYRLYVTKYK